MDLVDDTETPAEDLAPDDSDASEAGESDESLLKQAKDRFKLAGEAEEENRRLAKEDLEFRSGKQWPDDVVVDRQRDGRPCLVINRLPQFVQRVANDQRQNRPGIKVHPVNDGADEETAKLIQGLIRHIEYQSSADNAYDTAAESAATNGWGYFRILTDYASPKSFDQEILVKRIRDPFSVYFDPFAQEPDGSDANWAFVVDEMSRDEFKAKYPEAELTKSDWKDLTKSDPDWFVNDGARIAEYFYREYEEREIALLGDGQVVMADAVPAGSVVQSTRKARVPVVKWCKLNGVEILEKNEWPGSYIPIIPVYGSELIVGGKRILEGLIRNAKDSQRMYNYWASAQTEMIALAPKAPFVGAEGQFEGHEAKWESANRRNLAFLEYKPVSLKGQPAPPPQRAMVEPPVQAISQARMMAADDLKATTGIYDAALGNQSAETSGIAIQSRTQQSETSNFHFMDNLARSMKHAGRIIVELIPFIYDTKRTVQIVGEDGIRTKKIINEGREGQTANEDGRIYDLTVGLYDVTIDVGPSYATKRQEAAASMAELARSIPQIGQAAPDLMVRAYDWPGAQDIADRLKKTLPPQLQDDGKGGQPQVPPQVQAQMQQMGQMIEGLTKALHAAHDTIDQKRVELESKERIEYAKIKSNETIELTKLDAKDSIALLAAEIQATKHRLDLLNQAAPIGAPAPNSEPPQADAQSVPQGQAPQPPTGGDQSPGQTPGALQ